MPEYITTRTYYSKKLDEQTYAELTLIAKRLGILRKIIWHQFSSNPKKLNDRKIRDQWLKAKANGIGGYPKIIDELPARLYDKEINLYTPAEKVKEILIHRAEAVLSASVETAQLGLQDVAPINLGLHPKSGLSKKSRKKLVKVG